MSPPHPDTETIRDRIGVYADPEVSMAERNAMYEDLMGFVPPRIEARLAVTGALNPKLLGLQEQMRAHAMYPRSFDVKTAQIILFSILLMDLNDAAFLHGIAARRAGATWQELQDAIGLVFLFRGLSAANRGAEILVKLAKHEAEAEAKSKTEIKEELP